jgi:hypothetical protein
MRVATSGKVFGRWRPRLTALAIVALLGPSIAAPACAADSPPRLAGTVISGDSDVAVLVGDKQSAPRAVHRGEEFLGWRVERIEREQVMLSRDGRWYQVPLLGDPTAIAQMVLPDTDAAAPPPGSPPDPRELPHGLQ